MVTAALCLSLTHISCLLSVCLPWGPEDVAGTHGALVFDACFFHWSLCFELCLDSPSKEQE